MLWRYGLASEVFRHLTTVHTAMPIAERSVFHQFQTGVGVQFGDALAAAVMTYQFGGGDIRRLLDAAEVKKAVRALRTGMKISNVESDAVEGAMLGLAPLLAEALPTLAMKKRFLARPSADLSISLMRAIAATGELPERIALIEEQLRPLIGTEVAPAPLVTGDDLTAMGLTPGPRFKRILERIYDEQLEGRVTTRQQAAQLVHQIE